MPKKNKKHLSVRIIERTHKKITAMAEMENKKKDSWQPKTTKTDVVKRALDHYFFDDIGNSGNAGEQPD